MDAIVKTLIKTAGPALLTLAMVVVAALVLRYLWREYM
ncbi:efflux transporter periplasmic adaptor subunit, partial [Xanthomonas oryzae pv. oryzae]